MFCETLTENYDQMREYVQELMDTLTGENNHYNAIHELLTKEDFFTAVFKTEN